MQYNKIKLNGWYLCNYKNKCFFGKVTHKPKKDSALTDKEGHVLFNVTSIKDFKSWKLADVDFVRAAWSKTEVREALLKAKL